MVALGFDGQASRSAGSCLFYHSTGVPAMGSEWAAAHRTTPESGERKGENGRWDVIFSCFNLLDAINPAG